VRWMVIRRSLLLVTAGLAVGVPAAGWGTQVLQGLLFGLSPNDPASFGLAVVVMVIVGGVAAYLPARRASRIDPLIALRTE
jgi:ABC-type antimicrobial peptide transport system permease subunit